MAHTGDDVTAGLQVATGRGGVGCRGVGGKKGDVLGSHVLNHGPRSSGQGTRSIMKSCIGQSTGTINAIHLP